jgi:hypothetical protein
MNKDPIKCDECGKFISYKDIDDGNASHHVNYAWDWFQEDMSERWHSLCKRCNKKETNK